MILEYVVTKKDYEDVIYSDLKKRDKTGRLGCLLPSFIGFMLVGMVPLMMFSDNSPYLLPTMICSLVFIALLVVTSMRVQSKLILRGRIKSGGVEREYFGHHVLEAKDDRLLLRYGDIEGERFYGGIDHIEEYKTAVVIYLSSVACDIIPTTAFRDAEERHSFISLLQSRITSAKDVVITSEQVNKSREEAKYTIEYFWDEENYINALISGNRAFFKTKLAWSPGRIIMTIIGLVIVIRAVTVIIETVLTVPDYIQVSVAGLTFWLIIGMALLIQPIMVFTPWLRSIVIKQIRDGVIPRDMIGNHTVCVYDNKMKFFSRLSNQDVSLDQIYCIKRSDSCLILISKAKAIYLIPIPTFDSKNTLDEFIAFLEQKIENFSSPH